MFYLFLLLPLAPLVGSTFDTFYGPYATDDKPWKQEAWMGYNFAKNQDWQQATICLKRARFLSVGQTVGRRYLDFDIARCYWHADLYNAFLCWLEESELSDFPDNFPAKLDLAVMASYAQLQVHKKLITCKANTWLQKYHPQKWHKLQLKAALLNHDIAQLKALEKHQNYRFVGPLCKNIEVQLLSPAKAAFYNAILPGAGYLYVGQPQTGLTALLVNALFLSASHQFFHKGHAAIGIMTTSLEIGWWFGGIYGAKNAAHHYNTEIWGQVHEKVVREQRAHHIDLLELRF